MEFDIVAFGWFLGGFAVGSYAMVLLHRYLVSRINKKKKKEEQDRYLDTISAKIKMMRCGVEQAKLLADLKTGKIGNEDFIIKYNEVMDEYIESIKVMVDNGVNEDIKYLEAESGEIRSMKMSEIIEDPSVVKLQLATKSRAKLNLVKQEDYDYEDMSDEELDFYTEPTDKKPTLQ